MNRPLNIKKLGNLLYLKRSPVFAVYLC